MTAISQEPITPDQIPAAMVEAAALAVHEHSRNDFPNDPRWDGLSEWERDSYRRSERLALAAAFGVCSVRDQTGEAFDDEPTIVHVGSSLLTELMTRQISGRSVTRHASHCLLITSPGEKIS